MEEWSATSSEAVREALRKANLARLRVIPRGMGTRPISGPFAHGAEPTIALRTTGLDALESIDAEELVMTAQAGASLTAVAAALEPHGLFLPPLLDPRQPGTLGGLFSDPRESPLQPRLGAVRDHVLGIEAVRGDGVAFRAGGRVVKNVTGYDITRFLCGARGEWAVITRIHWRLLHRPAVTQRMRFAVDTARALWDGLDALRRSSCEPLAVTLTTPANVAAPGATSTIVEVLEAGTNVTCRARLERARSAAVNAGWGVVEAEPLSNAGHPAIDSAMPTTPASRARPVTPTATTHSPALDLRIRLPYSAWSRFLADRPPGLLWQAVYPFAHFGLARLARTDVWPVEPLRALRARVAALGGSIALETIPTDCPLDADPWGRGPSCGATEQESLQRITHALRRAWDSRGVLACSVDRSRA